MFPSSLKRRTSLQQSTICSASLILAAPCLPLTAGESISARKLCRFATGLERGLRTDDWAFLPAVGEQPARLYRKPDDIWEVNDLAARHPDECDALAAILDDRENSE